MQALLPREVASPHRNHLHDLTRRRSLLSSILEEAVRLGQEMGEHVTLDEASSAGLHPQVPQASSAPQAAGEGKDTDNDGAPLEQYASKKL